MVVVRPRIVRNNPNKVNTLEQTIVEVRNNYVKVASRKGNTYDVNLSDKVKLLRSIDKGDTAIVKTFPNGWLVTDIIKKEKEFASKEEMEEYERYLEDIEEIIGGY